MDVDLTSDNHGVIRLVSPVRVAHLGYDLRRLNQLHPSTTSIPIAVILSLVNHTTLLWFALAPQRLSQRATVCHSSAQGV